MLGSGRRCSEPEKTELGPASKVMIFKTHTVYSFMTSFPLRAPCHSAADLISCVLTAVRARFVTVVLEGRDAARDGGRRIVYPIISKLGRHFFFFHSFNVLAAPDTRREILLDVLSLSFFQTAAQMVSAGSEPALKDSCKVFFLKCKSLISDEWTEEINPILRSVSCVGFFRRRLCLPAGGAVTVLFSRLPGTSPTAQHGIKTNCR